MIRKRMYLVVTCMILLGLCCGCGRIREIVDSYEAPTEPIKTSNENEYRVVASDEEIEQLIYETMRANRTACYFNVMTEELIEPEKWSSDFPGIHEIKVEYSMVANGFNVFLTLSYWDNYPIVAAYEKNDTTILSVTQLELFHKYIDVLGEIITNNSTPYMDELAIHNYLVNNVTYATDNEKATTAYDAMIKGSAVCSGYAESFKTMLDLLGIENSVVKGESKGTPHIWNMVKLEDQWYHVDVTFDDPVGEENTLSYYYFNVTDEDIRLDHVWDYELTTPANATAYNYYTVNGTPIITDDASLDSMLTKLLNQKTKAIEFITQSPYEVDLNTALARQNIAMDVNYTVAKRTNSSIYSLEIAYK